MICLSFETHVWSSPGLPTSTARPLIALRPSSTPRPDLGLRVPCGNVRGRSPVLSGRHLQRALRRKMRPTTDRPYCVFSSIFSVYKQVKENERTNKGGIRKSTSESLRPTLTSTFFPASPAFSPHGSEPARTGRVTRTRHKHDGALLISSLKHILWFLVYKDDGMKWYTPYEALNTMTKRCH